MPRSKRTKRVSKKRVSRAKRDGAPRLVDAVAAIFASLPDVFSTIQWGGRAYKVARSADRSKFKLLAHVVPEEDGERIMVAFKLPPVRAQAMIEKHAWIEPHEFRTLAPSGWVTAHASRRTHLSMLEALLRESRDMYPTLTKTTERGDSNVASELERKLRVLQEDGWRPRT